MAMDPKDGGMKSRKFWYSVGTSGAILLIGMAAGTFAPALVPVLGEIYAALLGALTIYLAGNVVGKNVIGNVIAKTTEKAPAMKPLKGQPVEQSPEE